MAVILKYPEQVYQSKISTFESLDGQLMTHLSTLENLKNQIPNFWEGEQTGKYIEAISKAIVKVRQASTNVNSLKTAYTETMNEMGRLNNAVDGIVNEASSALDKAIDVAGAVAPFVV